MIIICTENDLNSHSRNVPFDKLNFDNFRVERKTFELASLVIIRNLDVMRVLKMRWDTDSFINVKPNEIFGVNKLNVLLDEFSQVYLGRSSFKPGTKKLKEK